MRKFKYLIILIFAGNLGCGSDSSSDNSLHMTLVTGYDSIPKPDVNVVLHDNYGNILSVQKSDSNGNVTFQRNETKYSFSVINPVDSRVYINTFVDAPSGNYVYYVSSTGQDINKCPTIQLTFSDSNGPTYADFWSSLMYSTPFDSITEVSFPICHTQTDGKFSVLSMQKEGLYGYVLDKTIDGENTVVDILMDRNVRKIERIVNAEETFIYDYLLGRYKGINYTVAFAKSFSNVDDDGFVDIAADFPVSRYTYGLITKKSNIRIHYTSFFRELPSQFTVPEIGFQIENINFNNSTLTWNRSDSLEAKYYLLRLWTSPGYDWEVIAPGNATQFTFPNFPDEIAGPIGSLTSYGIGVTMSNSKPPYPLEYFMNYYNWEEEYFRLIKEFDGDISN